MSENIPSSTFEALPPPPMLDDLPPPPNMLDKLPPPPSPQKLSANNIPPAPLFEDSHAKPRKLKGLELSLLHTCKICGQNINETFYVVCDEYYHINCLKCTECQKNLKPPNCIYFKNRLLCLNCSEIKEGIKKCSICKQYLLDFEPKIQPPGFNTPIHDSCFACYECSEHLSVGSFRLLEGYAFCQKCGTSYEKRKCAECNQIILDRYVHARGRFFHLEHFKCSQCDKVLKGNNYIIHHDKYYCPMHGSEFLKRCYYCKKEFTLTSEDSIFWHNKKFHKKCFVCRICGAKCDPENCKSFHERPHCDECFEKRINDEKVVQKKHIPEESMKRRNEFKKHFDKKEFNLPVYSKDVCEQNPNENQEN